MYSKLLAIVSVFVLFGGTGCSDYLGGKKADNQVIEMSNPRLECLKDLPAAMQNFSLGKSKSEDINEAFSCLEYSLSYFRDRTQGSFSDAYSSEDMRTFFGKYFLKENNISPQLAQSLMRLKKALLGGSEEHITKTEITQVIQLLNELRSEVEKLQPYILLLSLQNEPHSETDESLRAAVKQVRRSLHKVLANIKIQRSDYSFDEAKLLLSSLSEFIAGPQTFNFLEQTETILPVAQSVKEIIFGTDSFLISEKEWKAGLDSLIDLYALYLKYHYLLQGTGPDSLARVEQYISFGDECLALIESSHQMRRRSMIPFKPINELLVIGSAQSFIPGNLRPETIEKTYQLALRKVFESYQGTDNRGFEYLELRHLAAMRRELKVFQGNLKLIIAMGQKTKRTEVLRFLDEDNAKTISESLSPSSTEQEAILAGMSDFLGLLADNRLMQIGDHGKVLFLPLVQVQPWTWQGLVTLNLTHSVSRLLMLGYGERDVMRLGDGFLTSKSLSLWYQDFSDLGKELRIFDPRSKDPGARSAKEANFFTYSGNGDDKISFKEMNEYLALLISGGGNLGPAMKSSVNQANCQVSKRDIFGEQKYSEMCVRDQIRRFLSTRKAEMPGLVKAIGRFSNEKWNSYFNQMLVLVRSVDGEPGFLEVSEIRAISMIIHYSETLFISFDLDQDERLSVEEVRKAAPRFRSLIKDKVPLNYDELTDDVFVYLVMKGQVPDLWSYTYERSIEFLGLKEESFAGRENIVEVLSVMKRLSQP